MNEFKNEEEFLSKYNDKIYEKPSVTNDVLIFTTCDKEEENTRKVPRKGLQVLLIKRDEYPHKGSYAIPGGFVSIKEGLEEGAIRKLKEKTGIDRVYIEQLYTYGEVDRDKRTRVITVSNLALLEKDLLNSSEVIGEWFWIDKELYETIDGEDEIIRTYYITLREENSNKIIKYKVIEKTDKSLLRNKKYIYEKQDESNLEIAFDHIKILNDGIGRLRNKVEYTPIAFSLLPRLFTVKELQYVYEAIMGKEILNFRRKMGDMIIETDEKIEGKPYRPAQVFKFNKNWEHIF
ncbi:MAG: NUDIX hydrolase [Clostridium sp.]